MDLDTETLESMVPHVVAIAERAGLVLREHSARLREVQTEFKGRRELVTVADREAERVVVSALQRAWPDHAIQAEEGVLTPEGRADRDAELVWVIDPLDGTTNFVHALPFHCVAIGLMQGAVPLLGVVHAPALDQTFTAVRGGGAYRNGAPIAVTVTRDLGDALLATGFSYDRNEPSVEDNVARLARALPLCRDLRRYGSAQLDLCYTASGTYDGYWEMYLQPYDVAAGSVIVTEAGGRVTDLTGGDDWLCGGQVLASNGVLHETLLEVVGGAPGAGAER